MKLRLSLRGAVAGMLMGIGVAAIGGVDVSSVKAEAATPAATILVIDGHVSGGPSAAFDLAALQALPVTRITTMTPWTEGESVYEGVKIRDLLERVGARGDTLLADAVDEYQVRIPIEDIEDYDVIVAYAVDGKPLPEDDKGPLWIIYPYSEHSGLQKDLYFSRSVWQLKRLTVQ